MDDHLTRVNHFKGNPYEVGLATGRLLGKRLEQTIDHYIEGMKPISDMGKLHEGAMSWLQSLPKRFQEEIQGITEGANISTQKYAEWGYIEECEAKQCSGAVYLYKDQVWVARNNDTFVPEMWGYASIREVEGRIPTISFTMEGDVFTPTGINQEKLWLHYNALPVWDKPTPGKAHLPAYVFLIEALERCRTIRDVEAVLNETDRDSGMLIFAVDGKNNEFALFECLCSKHFRRDPTGGWIVGTNHYCACEDLSLGDDEGSKSTVSRFKRMEHLMQALSASEAAPNLPADLIKILADDQVERRGKPMFTVYANVACPSSGEIWYTFGGYPAASQGSWHRLEWPWARG